MRYSARVHFPGVGARWAGRVGALLASLAVVIVSPPRPSNGESIPIVNIDPSTQGTNESHGNGMVGWDFSLLQPITVTQVGWYDDGENGLSRDFQVGLWGSTQLLGDPDSGLIIPAGTNAALNGSWRVVDLSTPLDLQPGYYTLGGLDSVTTPDVIKYFLTTNFPGESDPTLTGSRLTIGGFFYGGITQVFEPPGFHRPTIRYLTYGLEMGPMLFFNVPEPGTGLLVMTGLLGIAARSKRRG